MTARVPRTRTSVAIFATLLAGLALAPTSAFASLPRADAPALTTTPDALAELAPWAQLPNVAEFHLPEGELRAALEGAKPERASLFEAVTLAGPLSLPEPAIVETDLASSRDGRYPENRIRAFWAFGQEVVGVGRGVSLELRWGSARFGLGLASVGREDPLGLQEAPGSWAATQERLDRIRRIREEQDRAAHGPGFLSDWGSGVWDTVSRPFRPAATAWNEAPERARRALENFWRYEPKTTQEQREVGADYGAKTAAGLSKAAGQVSGAVVAGAIKGGQVVVETEAGARIAGAAGSAARRSLAPGTAEHRAARWSEYETRGGSWSRERWDAVYDENMVRAARSNKAADAYQARLGWGRREVTVDVEGVPRRLDIADVARRRGVEVKTGYQTATQENLWEIERDRILAQQGWDIQWRFEGPASEPLLKALDAAGIPHNLGR